MTGTTADRYLAAMLEQAAREAGVQEGGIVAERTLRASAAELFEFLSDLERHWRLADRFVEVLELEREGPGEPVRGGRVRVHGPLGLRRTALTRVTDVEPHSRVAGIAEIGRGTLARISWTLLPAAAGTRVRLSARLDRASPLDRLLLAAGGREWVRRRFSWILASLEAHQ